jgi:hypothetical protein
MTTPATFATEAALCAAFLQCVPKEWVAYPESCGFDIVLAHKETGAQIGIEAKLVLNAKVLVQVTEDRDRDPRGPDFRAVLVGKVVAENAILAKRLGIKVLTLVPRRNPKGYSHVTPRGYPESDWVVNRGGDWLPEFAPYKLGRGLSWWSGNEWEDEAPVERLKLPDYVPQVAAGVPAPVKLTDWMIQAIRMCITVDQIDFVGKKHFQHLKLSQSRWTQGQWLESTGTRGVWRAGRNFPAANFRKTHPVSYAQIEADWPEWGAPLIAIAAPEQGALL